ncbi:MAG: hypothetical protein H7842_10465 [Gammaproteobacteria bacterium SHHR-1]
MPEVVDAQVEFIRVHRLDQVVVRARAQAGEAVVSAATGRDDNDAAGAVLA